MMKRRTLALLVVLVLGLVLLTATTSSARSAYRNSWHGSGACGQVALRDDGDEGDDDRWGHDNPGGDEGEGDVPEPPEEDGEGEGDGNVTGRKLRLASMYTQLRFATMHLKYILATLY